MKIKDVLQRDPSAHPLVNQGQARISDKSNEKVFQELRGELSTFVCEGQYADGIQRILSSFLLNLAQTSQKAAWVSGFFGSGKSHLLKMLCHLWADTKFPDGATARSLVPSMPDDLRELLRALDTAGKRAGGLLAAAGALPSGTTDNVRLTILAVLLRGVGLPDQYPQTQFCLWLHDQGWFDKVKRAVEAAGKQWTSELNNLYVSSHIARALIACDANFASDEKDARNTLKTQFPPRNTDITTEEFLSAIKRVLKLHGRDGRMPCTILVLDEVQQYIGDSNDRSTLVTEVTEARPHVRSPSSTRSPFPPAHELAAAPPPSTLLAPGWCTSAPIRPTCSPARWTRAARRCTSSAASWTATAAAARRWREPRLWAPTPPACL